MREAWWGIARPSPKTSDLTAAKLSRLLLLPWEAKQRAGAFPSLNLYCHSLLEATGGPLADLGKKQLHCRLSSGWRQPLSQHLSAMAANGQRQTRTGAHTACAWCLGTSCVRGHALLVCGVGSRSSKLGASCVLLGWLCVCVWVGGPLPRVAAESTWRNSARSGAAGLQEEPLGMGCKQRGGVWVRSGACRAVLALRQCGKLERAQPVVGDRPALAQNVRFDRREAVAPALAPLGSKATGGGFPLPQSILP